MVALCLRTVPLLVFGLRPGVHHVRRTASRVRTPVPGCTAVLDETSASTMCVPEWLEERVQAALVEAYGPEWGDTDPLM